MYNFINKCVKISLVSFFMLIMTFSARAENIGVYHNNEVKSDLLSKDDEIDKNITNVKVNYNPIAEQITVSFKLSKSSIVVIKLMDALGNEVLNLSNTTLESGLQNFSFETEGKVASGFYFIRVTSGIDTVVKRVSIR